METNPNPKIDIKSRSKFLSKVLRHQPELVKIKLDTQGWIPVDELLAKIAKHGPGWLQPFDREILEAVVAENDKKRFAFSDDGLLIRANQGHSITIDLGYEAQEPPEILFHGTAHNNIASIKASGIHKGSRHHVHLSPERETATRVGGRHGTPVVLTIRAREMHLAGHLFYCSDNGVWLTDSIPVEFIYF